MNRFNPGKVVATPGAFAAWEASGESLFDYLARHLDGDWGEVDAEDARENELSLKNDLRLLSAYTIKNGTKIWVITEADRSSMCLRLRAPPKFAWSRDPGPVSASGVLEQSSSVTVRRGVCLTV